MRKKKGDITQDELLAILEQSGRSNFTKRQLTQLTGEGLLPQLRRIARAGSNRPVHVWGQAVIEQAKYLNDLICEALECAVCQRHPVAGQARNQSRIS